MIEDAFDDACAALLEMYLPVRLDSYGYRRMRDCGLTRAAVRRAADDLVKGGRAIVRVEATGVVIERAEESGRRGRRNA